MTFNFLGPGLTVNVEAKVKEQIILDSSDFSLIADTKRHKNEIFSRIQSENPFGFEKNKKTSLTV